MDEDDALLKVRVRLEPGDLRAVLWWHLLRSGSGRIMLALPVLFLAGLIAYHIARPQPASLWILALPLLFSLVVSWTLARSASRAFAKNPKLREEKTYTLTECGVRTESAGSEGFVEWKAVAGLVETGRFFLLRLGGSQFLCMPKRCLAPDDPDRLRRITHDRVEAEKARRS